MPVNNPDGTLALDREEYPRPQTTAESLANLQPAFEGLMDLEFFDSGRTYREWVAERWPGLEVDHRHHAGSSSGVVDGAGALVIASQNMREETISNPEPALLPWPIWAIHLSTF